MKKLIKPLTLRNVIDALVIYDIEHCRFPHNYLTAIISEIPPLGGLALADKKLILIDSEQGEETTREIIIHELLHCKHYQIGDLKGFNSIERQVQKETNLTYKLLYGVKKK